MVDHPSAAAPVPEPRVALVAGTHDRTTVEQLQHGDAVEEQKRAEAPERMVARLTMAENQATGRAAERLSAGLRAVRDQLEALRELVVAGRLEARVAPEPASVAIPDAVAQLERTTRAVVGPAAPPPPVRVEIDTSPAPLDLEAAPAPPPIDTARLPRDVDTALAPRSDRGLAPVDLDVAMAPASVDTGLAPLNLDTSLAPTADTGLAPADLDVALAPASVDTALLPVRRDVDLVAGEGNGMVAAGVPTTLGAIRSAALLVTNDPVLVAAPETPAGDGVPVVLQHRPFDGASAPAPVPLAEPAGVSQALLHVDLAELAPEQLGLQELLGAHATQALPVIDDAVAAVDRAAADLGRVREEIGLAAERAVLAAVPPEPVGAQVIDAVTDEVRASIALQAVAALMASVAGLDRRHAERLIIDAPAYARAARRPAPVQALAMSASAARS